MGSCRTLTLAYALAAAEQAFTDADIAHEVKEKVGIVWGTGNVGIPDHVKMMEKAYEIDSLRRTDRMISFKILRHMVG
jgi:3-oxoacyl-(acyl-carrier-protein) synthase